MTNGEKFKTAGDRYLAYQRYREAMRVSNLPILHGEFEWLELEYKIQDALKPCPFCGGKAILYGQAIPYIRCENCKVQTVGYTTIEEAIDAWNRRAK